MCRESGCIQWWQQCVSQSRPISCCTDKIRRQGNKRHDGTVGNNSFGKNGAIASPERRCVMHAEAFTSVARVRVPLRHNSDALAVALEGQRSQ